MLTELVTAGATLPSGGAIELIAIEVPGLEPKRIATCGRYVLVDIDGHVATFVRPVPPPHENASASRTHGRRSNVPELAT